MNEETLFTNEQNGEQEAPVTAEAQETLEEQEVESTPEAQETLEEQEVESTPEVQESAETQEISVIQQTQEVQQVEPEQVYNFCSNCGAELLSGTVFCFKCGARIEENQITPGYSNNVSKRKNKLLISIIGAVIVAVAILIAVFAVNSVQKSNLQKQLLRDWERVEGNNGAYILCILDFTEDEIEYKVETGYKWMDTTIATYKYKVVSGNKIKVNRVGDYWETVEVEFNDDKAMMTFMPALTSVDDTENWFNID